MASEGRVAWWGGADLPSTGARDCGAKQRQKEGGAAESEEKAALQACEGGGEARAEGARPCRARRKAQKMPHNAPGGQAEHRSEMAIRLRPASGGGAACGGRCPDSRKNGIPDAGLWFCAAVFPRASFSRRVRSSREARVGFHSGRRSAVLVPRRQCSASDGARRSAPARRKAAVVALSVRCGGSAA